MKFNLILAAAALLFGQSSFAMVNCNAAQWTSANLRCQSLHHSGACECQVAAGGAVNVICDNGGSLPTAAVSVITNANLLDQTNDEDLVISRFFSNVPQQ